MGARPLKFAQWMLAPSLPSWQARCLADLRRRVPADSRVSWVLSSGTSSHNRVKCIGLDHEAFYASARAVNQHLTATRADRWLVAIPTYHVGGFSILVRAHLTGSLVSYLPAWSARAFTELITRERITLCSLVPTQIFDLVTAGATAPPSLRAIVVGGGMLDESLYARARALGWPVLTSYGLTETASQVATASLATLEGDDYPTMTVLPHAEIETRDQRIFIRAESLCRWIAVSDGTTFSLEDPRRGGWLPTEDLGEFDDAAAVVDVGGGASGHGGGLRVLGRRDDIVKVLGVLVSTAQVARDAEAFAGSGFVLALPDARAGHRLIFVTEATPTAVIEAIARYNREAMGPFRIDQVCSVGAIPRGDLGKVKKAELLARLNLL